MVSAAGVERNRSYRRTWSQVKEAVTLRCCNILEFLDVGYPA